MAAFVVAHKTRDLAADDQIVQRLALGKHLPGQAVQAGYIDVVCHAPCSLAARIDTPMALSLANLPGTNRAPGTRADT